MWQGWADNNPRTRKVSGVEIPPEDYRVSDRDREAFAARLATAFQDGRLDPAEYEQRLGLVYAAKTFRELIPQTLDLPDRDHVVSPAGVVAPVAGAGIVPGGGQGQVSAAFVRMPTALRVLWTIWGSAVAVNVVVYGIVAATSDFSYPWPLWVAGPSGAVLGVVTWSTRPFWRRRPKQG